MSDSLDPHTARDHNADCSCGWKLRGVTAHEARAGYHGHACLPEILADNKRIDDAMDEAERLLRAAGFYDAPPPRPGIDCEEV